MSTNTFAFYGAVVGIVGFTIAPSLYFGHKTNLQAELLDRAADRLTAVPAQFGPWMQREENSFDETTWQILGKPRYLARTYVNRNTGESVSVVIMAGSSGPMAVHTPEICMPSREYEMINSPEKTEVLAAGGKQQFFASLFRAKTLEGQKLNVYYGWSRDAEVWEAPANPRITFGPLPMLYKVQVVSAEPVVATQEAPAGKKFLVDLLPLLKSH